MLPSANWYFLDLLALNFMGISLKFFISSILTSNCNYLSLEAWWIRFFKLISIIFPWVAFSTSSLSFFLAALWWLYFFFFCSCIRSNSLCYISTLCFLNLSWEALSTYLSFSKLASLIISRFILFYTIFVKEAGFFKVFVSKSL